MIHGPKEGYDNGKKRHYRRQIHRFADNALGPSTRHHVPVRDRRVLILDESEGLECLHLIDRGYRPELIHVVNKSPAKMAVLQSRVRQHTGGRSINTYGSMLHEAIDAGRINGTFDLVHLDLTSNCNDKSLAWICRAAMLLDSGSVIAVNLQKGREFPKMFGFGFSHHLKGQLPKGSGLTVWIQQNRKASTVVVTPEDFDRFAMMFAAICCKFVDYKGRSGVCRLHSENLIVGSYRAGKVPMVWLAAQVLKCDDIAARAFVMAATSIAGAMATERLGRQEQERDLLSALYLCPHAPVCVLNAINFGYERDIRADRYKQMMGDILNPKGGDDYAARSVL